MQDWWNQWGAYCFLIQCNIPMSVDNLIQTMWQFNIHRMLQHIPTIAMDGPHHEQIYGILMRILEQR